MKVLIVSGGNSSERRISLMSAKQVKTALEKSGHNVKVFDFKRGSKELSKQIKNFDVVFPVLHGEEGEGGELQRFLMKLAMPYVGGHPDGYEKAWYKIPLKKHCDENGIKTARWREVKNKKEILEHGFPSVLKTDNGGSSREVVILKSEKDLSNYQTKKLLKSGNKLYVEDFLPGIEITVGILHDQPLPVIEIVPPEGKWFDYKNKYWGETQEIPHAPSLTEKQRMQAQKIALKIHQHHKLGPICRIDFIVSNGEPHVLEVNTIPGMTSGSLLPKAAQANGIAFEELVHRLITSASNSYS